MLVESPNATSYFMAMVMLDTVCEIFTVKIFVTSMNWQRSNVNIPVEPLAIARFVTVCAIFTYELSNKLDVKFDFERKGQGR